MALQYYSWPPGDPLEGAVEIAGIDPVGDRNPAHYVPHTELVEAINVALVLGMPLLLTGEPGTGKTELARSLAWQLGLGEPLKFVAKSTSQSRDLFYHYDALGRLYAAQMAKMDGADEETKKKPADVLNFIEYAALGKALLRAQDYQTQRGILDFVPTTSEGKKDLSAIGHTGAPGRSVVIIDEIDKAPRDFSNDLLDELENMRFRVPELKEDYTPEIPRSMRPIVLITSNSERQLPEAFMRRCLYFHIPFPMREGEGDYNMENIVAQRLGRAFSQTVMVRDALDLFYTLREQDRRLRKPPATAELLNWLVAMRAAGASEDKGLREQAKPVMATRTALLKNSDDRKQGRAIIEDWLEE